MKIYIGCAFNFNLSVALTNSKYVSCISNGGTKIFNDLIASKFNPAFTPF